MFRLFSEIYMDKATDLLMAKCADMERLCRRRCEPVFSNFLDGGEIADIGDKHFFSPDVQIKYFGGYAEAERKILGVFPEWETEFIFPIKVLFIKSSFTKKLTHRDYLGTMLSQGIDRNKTGDIIVDDGSAYAFVCADIAQYLADNIEKISNQGVSISVTDICDIDIPEPKKERISAVCASKRLDAVVGAVCNISRAQSARLINAGLVKLDHRECVDVSKVVSDNSLISVRGYGRFVFIGGGGETRKGRLHITADKYV